MDLGLKDKVVLVTGASKGLGAAIAVAFGQESRKLVLVARTQTELDQVAVEAQKAGAAEVLAIAADLIQTHEIERIVSTAINQFGTIHVLVNNAGILGSFSSFADLTDDEWFQVFNLNLFSIVKLTRAVIPYMVQQTWGRIINLSSESGLQPDAAMPHYSATKAFRTAFNGALDSPDQLIDDYSTTSGQMLEWLRQMNGQQPGDPKKAAAAMIQVVNHPNPPLRLVLGSNTLEAFHAKLEAVAADLAAWKNVAINTAFKGAAVNTILQPVSPQ